MRTPSPPRAAIERRFRDLHAETYADLVRFVERRSFGNDAEDVVSAVFMTAWRRIDDMPEDARPWLFGIARKQMQNAARGAARQRDLDVAIAAHADSTPRRRHRPGSTSSAPGTGSNPETGKRSPSSHSTG
jgi:DNA-directed RNA polymerase specialized sigma24 family protein